ncbi:MAG: hypothetical protein ACTSXQ_07310 [Alphaproteobacteria bacterium]
MLSKSARSTLLQLANNTTLIGQTQQRISSGRKFDSVIEGGSDYLKARGYQKSADELLGYKQNMDDGLNVIKSTISGVKSSKSMLEQLRSVAEDAQDGSLSEALAASRAGNIVAQYDNLVGDTGLQGVNLVDGSISGASGEATWNDITGKFSADLGSSSISLYDVKEYNGALIASGYDDDAGESKLLHYDGTTWTDIISDTGYANLDLGSIYKYGEKIIVVGEDLDSGEGKIVIYDGSTWTDVSAEAGTTDFYYADFSEYNGELYVSVGSSGDSNLLTYDGSTWTDITSSTGFFGVSSNYSQEYDGKLFMAMDAYSGPSTYSRKLMSYDGAGGWQEYDINTILGLSSHFESYELFEYNGNLLLSGREAASGDNHIVSYDGTTWTDITSDTGSSDLSIDGYYKYDGKLFISGFDNDVGASKFLGYDGTTWTDIEGDLPISNVGIESFHEYNGEFFISAYDQDTYAGKLLSYDGTVWSDLTSDLPYPSVNTSYFNGIYEYDSQLFVAIYDDDISKPFLFTYGSENDSEGYNVNFSANTTYGVNTKDLTSTSVDLDIATLDFTAAGAADTIARIDTAIDQMEIYERQLTTSSILIQTRIDFTETMSSSFTEMYDKLTLVDVNEEAANLMALQTQQQLMMNTLSFGMESQASLLSLFR